MNHRNVSLCIFGALEGMYKNILLNERVCYIVEQNSKKNEKMKKMILAATVLLATIGFASAQSRPALRLDANFVGSNLMQKAANTSVDNKMMVGLRVGAAAEFALSNDGFYLAPGLVYTMRGAKAELSETTTRLHYLQIPVNAGMRFSFADNMAISLEAGPYFAYGVAGKVKAKVVDVTVSVDAFGDNGYNRFDLGLGLSAALSYDRYYVQIGYEHGLLNMLKDAPDKTSLRNHDFFVGLGVRF